MINEPSYAISIRIEHVKQGAYRGRLRHDLRQGPQPQYIDSSRTLKNSVIIAAPSLPAIRKQCEKRRSLRVTKRAMKSDAAIATAGIVTWGRGLQYHVEALSVDDQNELYRAVSDAVARECGSTLAGLVVHRDETAPHAHLWMPAVALDGRPISQYVSRRALSALQDAAMEAAKPWLPMIQPPERKADRIARGDDASKIYHRSVAQLHADLPLEIESAKNRLDDIHNKLNAEQVRLDEMHERVTQLELRESRTDKEEKRLAVYRRRLAVRKQDLEDKEREIEAKSHEVASVAAGAVMAVIDGRITPGVRKGILKVDPNLQPSLRPIWQTIGPTLDRLSIWWEKLKSRVDQLPDSERESILDLSELDDPWEITYDLPDPKPKWGR